MVPYFIPSEKIWKGVCSKIDKKAGSSGSNQIDLLMQYAHRNHYYPMYCFYNDPTQIIDDRENLLHQKLICKAGKVHLPLMGCTIMPIVSVKKLLSTRVKLVTHQTIITQGHSLACLACTDSSSSTQDIIETLTAALTRYTTSERRETSYINPSEMIESRIPESVVSLTLNKSIDDSKQLPKDKDVNANVAYVSIMADQSGIEAFNRARKSRHPSTED